MFNSEHLKEFKRGVAFEQLNASSRILPSHFLGRPPPHNIRTQIIPNRLPSACFRSIPRSVIHPHHSIRHIIHSQNRLDYQTFMSDVKQNNAELPMFSQPPANFVQNEGSQLYFPHRNVVANNVGNRMYPALNVQNSLSHDFGISDDLWIETKSPDGRKYYYNAKSRESKWEQPENVRIMTLQQIKLIASNENGSQAQDSLQMNRPTLTLNPPRCFGHYINTSLPMPGNARMIMFPPPTLCAPPVFPAVHPVLPVRDIANCNLNVHNIPYISPANLAGETSTLNASPSTYVYTDFNEYSKGREQQLVTNDNLNKELEHINQIPGTVNDNNNRIEHASVSEKSPQVLNSTEISAMGNNDIINDTISDALESITDSAMDIDKTATNELSYAIESVSASSVDTGRAISNNFHNTEEAKNEKETNVEQLCSKEKILRLDETDDSNHELITMKQKYQEVDKSRPVSSTPIPGTVWCVVWTGDNRVFFYDSCHKVSVWNQPEELKTRPEVQKLIENPPVKQESETSGPGIKKMKVEDSRQSSDDSIISNEHTKSDDVAKEIKTVSEQETVNCIQAKMPYEERLKIFRQILIDNNVSAFSTWEKELHKMVSDPRYALISLKERKKVFDTYVKEKLQEEKDKKSKEARCSREKYNQFLLEAGVTSTMRFSEFAERYHKDERFKAIPKVKEREMLFKEFIIDLRKKEKERKAYIQELKERFFQLLNEQTCLSKSSHWSETEQTISNDDRYKEIADNLLCEKLFREYIRKLSGDVSLSDTNEKAERQNSSIRFREEEVKKDLSVHMKERDREREIHKHDLAVNGFKALLSDLIRNADITWHEAKRLMKKDNRWEVVYCLTSAEREKIFDDHVRQLLFKKRQQFRQILDEIPEITLTSSWSHVRQTVLRDSRCSKFSSKERKCEKEFEDYMKDKFIAAKADFKDLLKETKLITYKSKELLKTDHLQNIEKILENDKRYLVLESFKRERKEILLSYIDKLYAKGPPPPPTATDPSKHAV